MDEEQVETDVPTVGERLRAAREEKGMSLEDIAAQTRIPQRHLEAIEASEWDKLPAPTYTTGFAKSYASAIGLGADNFSITPAGVGPVKAMVRSLEAAAIRTRLDQLLARPPKDVRKALTDWARRHNVTIG